MSIVVNKTRLPVTQWQTEIGSVVSISDARKRYAKSLSVALEPIQDLHGYSNPWVGGAGANLLDPSKTSVQGTDGAHYNIHVEFDSSTCVWRFSGTASTTSANAAFNFLAYDDYSLSNLSYKIQAFEVSGTGAELFKSVYGFRTATEKVCAIVFNFSAVQTIDVTLKISVSATNQSAWSPYSNICPISGRSSVTANRSGKNLLGTTLYAGVSYNPTVGADWSGRYVSVNQFTPNADSSVFTITLGSWASRAMFAKVKPNTAYKLKASLSGEDCATTYGWLDENNLVLTKFNTTGATVNLNTTITSPNNAGWFYLLIAPRSRQQTLTFTEPQFEYSPQTAYEPFQGISVTLSLGQTVYGGSVDLVSGVMTVKKALQTWTKCGGAGSSAGCFYVLASVPITKAVGRAIATYLKTHNGIGNSSNMPNWSLTQSGGGQYTIWCKLDSSYTSKTDFDDFLALNPLSICYELATPQTIQLSTNQIEMLMRNNTIWSDAGVVTLEYARIR